MLQVNFVHLDYELLTLAASLFQKNNLAVRFSFPKIK